MRDALGTRVLTDLVDTTHGASTSQPSNQGNLSATGVQRVFQHSAHLAMTRPVARSGKRLPQRTNVAGSELALVVLAAARRQCVGIDLASGALVRLRASNPLPDRDPLRVFDVVATRVWPVPAHERLEQPEAVLAGKVTRIGGLSGRRAARLMRPLLHPTDAHLLGFAGPCAPFWTFDGSRPSVGVVQPENAITVTIGPKGVRCRFLFRGMPHDLALEDPAVLSRLDWVPTNTLGPRTLRDVLQFRPDRLLVALSRPTNGYCHKVIAALLPGR